MPTAQPVAKTSEPRLSTVHGFIPYNPAEWTDGFPMLAGPRRLIAGGKASAIHPTIGAALASGLARVGDLALGLKAAAITARVSAGRIIDIVAISPIAAA